MFIKLIAAAILFSGACLVLLIFHAFALVLSIALGQDPIKWAEHHVTLTEKGVRSQWEGGRIETDWETIPRIVSFRRLILIFISDRRAHAIPKRAFPSVYEAEAFLLRAKDLRKEVVGRG